ncbi:SDR family oxidoreductase [Candidatus Nitrosocosmicus hydrocola]|uniref:SDR family oxidoreductase n=1 Tax=Candidatus Nitrosocosmicus hydrocola TaxID=1826872 RepID=UPI000AF7AACE|nr:SDR family oxidoreductase [Candidatus Nitrosocosmicus hydrocola]
MSSEHKKVAVVTGSSTGIGLETSLELARNGFLTCATMRDLKKAVEIENIAREENLPIKVFEMNVDDDGSVNTAITKIVDEYGRIDILVNNAGYGLFGALEDFTMDEIKKQFETNVFGVMRVIQNVLPTMRQQIGGIIINVSSMSGLAGIPSQSVYSATKFAVEGMSEALSYELEPFGIKMILIEPGIINTEFVQDLVLPSNKYGVDKEGIWINPFGDDNKGASLSFYNDTIQKFLTFYFNAMSKAPHPQVVANEIITSIGVVSEESNTSNPLLRITVGNDSKKYSKLKKELTDYEFHSLLKSDLLK